MGERAAADHAVQTYLAAGGGGDAELCAGQGLAGDAVPFLDNQGTLRLIFEGQADRPALLDLDSL